ncbi:hypothetical protein EI77_00663 [Prosthecobacter fusiformis]|uniref:Uncharacterized protein n=1 Tax=Prosthecobacter fusiformis TaxID=48464 RepID=A0A4R7ST08_9BACT|nr:hypothetical protein EI77_00663 [Prosthecobacter fusiformis]
MGNPIPMHNPLAYNNIGQKIPKWGKIEILPHPHPEPPKSMGVPIPEGPCHPAPGMPDSSYPPSVGLSKEIISKRPP